MNRSEKRGGAPDPEQIFTPRLSISDAAALSGVDAHRLRAWEKRYGAVRPGRTRTGRRLYSDADVERLRLLEVLVHRGHRIGRIAALKTDELRQLARSGRVADRGEREKRYQAELMAALGRFDLRLLSKTLRVAQSEFAVREFLLKIISPLLEQVGCDVMEGALTIAQEHALSAILRDHLGSMYYSLAQGPDAGAKRVMITSPEGELHEFGLLIAAVMLASRGLSVQYLGPNLPWDSIREAVSAFQPDYLLLGAVYRRAVDRRETEERLSRLCADVGESCSVWAGGVLADTDGTAAWTSIPTLEDLDERVSRMAQPPATSR